MFHQHRHLKFTVKLILVVAVVFVVKETLFPDSFNPVIIYRVERAKARLHQNLLRADMNKEQVIMTLGLSNCWHVARGGGAESAFHTTYDLGGGHYASVLYSNNMISGESTLRSVRVDDETWEPQ